MKIDRGGRMTVLIVECDSLDGGGYGGYGTIVVRNEIAGDGSSRLLR